jgi:hypothetical protein
MLDASRPLSNKNRGSAAVSRDVAQLGQRTCFGIISELALCYPASSQLACDRKWSIRVRSCTLP